MICNTCYQAYEGQNVFSVQKKHLNVTQAEPGLAYIPCVYIFITVLKVGHSDLNGVNALTQWIAAALNICSKPAL